VLLDMSAWGSADAPAEDQSGAVALLHGAGWGVTVVQPDVPMNRVWANLCRTGNKRGDVIMGAGQ
jgi:hypothetical protein